VRGSTVRGASTLGISARGGVAQFEVMRVLAAAQARRLTGRPVYDFSTGQPSTSAPAPVLAAARRALDSDRIGYTGALGLPELRAGIAGHYQRSYGVDVDLASVVVTTGSSGGLQLAFLAAFDPGDTVVVTRPGYPAVRNMLLALGCDVLDLALDGDFRLTVAQLEALPGPPAGLVLASPANPTGTMLSGAELAAIVHWCDRHQVRFISDEIYHGITYGEQADTAWQSSRSPIVLSSFSKFFSMTGWRLGWLLVPDELLDSVERLSGNFTICAPTLSQHAGVAAFDAYDELEANLARYRINRDAMLERLPKIGLDRLAPVDGAFYVYADVSEWTEDSLGWARRLLDETGVAVAPGIDFDHRDGQAFIRFCFAGDLDEITTGIEVLGDYLSAHKP
jgi:aspartate/methionine/tyrosine aminotransferase